jgi:hypothetical protein
MPNIRQKYILFCTSASICAFSFILYGCAEYYGSTETRIAHEVASDHSSGQ